MTLEDYIAKRQVLRVEMDRIRHILDSAALAEHKYGIKRSPELLQKVHKDLDSVIERYK